MNVIFLAKTLKNEIVDAGTVKCAAPVTGKTTDQSRSPLREMGLASRRRR
ncbi:MAG: hypothetical protein JWM58_2239 [Rhizobium sp.]|nr:hypothetical protein [Rhizobium sp.]